MFPRGRGAGAYRGETTRPAAHHRRGIHLRGWPQAGGAGNRSCKLWRAQPVGEPVSPRYRQRPLHARAGRSGELARWLLDHLAAAFGQGTAAAARRRPLAARTLLRPGVDRRGTADRRLRYAAPGISRDAGPGTRSAVRRRRRRAHASAQPPCFAGRADGDPLENTIERGGLCLVSQRGTVFAAIAAFTATLSGAPDGADAHHRRTLYVRA